MGIVVSIVYTFHFHFIRFNGVYNVRKALSTMMWINYTTDKK